CSRDPHRLRPQPRPANPHAFVDQSPTPQHIGIFVVAPRDIFPKRSRSRIRFSGSKDPNARDLPSSPPSPTRLETFRDPSSEFVRRYWSPTTELEWQTKMQAQPSVEIEEHPSFPFFALRTVQRNLQ